MSNMLYILGDRLAQLTGTQEMICRGMLRLSIMDSLPNMQTADGQQALAYMKAMTYADWQVAIESQALSSRLAAIRVKEPATVVAQLKRTLVEKQSLLTLSAR